MGGDTARNPFTKHTICIQQMGTLSYHEKGLKPQRELSQLESPKPNSCEPTDLTRVRLVSKFIFTSGQGA